MGTTTAPIADIARFFDRLVDLIPPKHYLNAGEAINLKYLKRTERESTKAAFKDEYKKSKKARLDPDAAQTTTSIQRQLVANDDMEPSISNAAPPTSIRANLSSTTSREELQKRLEARLLELRRQRRADDEAKTANAAKEWRKAKLKESAIAASKSKKRLAQTEDSRPSKQQRVENTAPTNDANPTFVFNNLRMEEGDHKGKKGKPKTKQQLLKDAEERLAQAEELGKTSEGKAKLKAEAWKKMMKLAQGEKILDNPQLLRRSIKKENKLKAKKSEAWVARTDAVKEKMAKTQQRRQDNLQKRVDEKKAKKIARREKKLLRAGFEGRKDTFIK